MRALGVVLALLAATPVQAGWLLAEACPRAGAVELLLLPEDRDALDAAPAGAVTVTGGYTATDRRDGDRPKPVGLHLRRGEAVNREFGRMEGLLLVPADAPPAIHARPLR